MKAENEIIKRKNTIIEFGIFFMLFRPTFVLYFGLARLLPSETKGKLKR
jgi:hypothetical protein